MRAIARDGDHWRVETDQSRYRAEHIVNAAGTWAWEVGDMMGLNLPVVPVLHQYLVTETVAAIANRQAAGLPELPIIRDPEQSWYVRQERDGLILGPYERDAKIWSVDGVPEDFGAELLPPDLDRVESIISMALDRIPALAESGIKTVVNGPITFTPDANPLIGPAHGVESAWLLTGSSMGVMEGGGAGWFLAHWMTHGAPPMDAQAVDSRRFGNWADRDYRIDKAIECFGLQFGVHYPYEERPAGRNKRVSPLHEIMLEKGAIMGAINGWERPNWFSDRVTDGNLTFGKPLWFDAVGREVDALCQHAALADLSVLSKFRISGPQTRTFIESLGANRAPATGRIGLTHVLSPAGGVISEFSIAMIDDSQALLTSAAASERIDLDQLQQHATGFDITIDNVTADYACIGMMGPATKTLLNQVAGADVTRDFRWLDCRQLIIAGMQVLALRVSYVGECGWEFYLKNSQAVALYQLFANSDSIIGHYGAYAANAMRLEKGYPAWGSELTTERTPEESAAARFVKTVNRQFTGRDALIERRGESAWRTLLLQINAEDVYPYHGHPVFLNDRVVGVITSAAYGHRCKKTLAFALLRDHASLDGLEVEILGRRYPATTLDTIPVDPTNTRMTS